MSAIPKGASRSKRGDCIDLENDAPAWFLELLLAVDNGDYQRAAWAQGELRRLGWNVTRQKVEVAKEDAV